MLCCVHLTVNLWVSSKYYGFLYLSRCLIFKVLRTFWKVFCRFLPNLSQQCVNYYITFIFVCQHFFKVFKKFFEISFITFKSFFLCFQTFLLFVLSSSDFVSISLLFTNCNPFFQFFYFFLKNNLKAAYLSRFHISV